LDEGKFSFPLVYAWNSDSDNLQLREIFQRRRDMGGLSEPHKLIILDHLRRSGSLEYTRGTLERLQSEIDSDVSRLEAETGRKNWIMRLLLQKLRV
jgi:geranylgeranyl pyrophosphate synthase